MSRPPENLGNSSFRIHDKKGSPATQKWQQIYRPESGIALPHPQVLPSSSPNTDTSFVPFSIDYNTSLDEYATEALIARRNDIECSEENAGAMMLGLGGGMSAMLIGSAFELMPQIATKGGTAAIVAVGTIIAYAGLSMYRGALKKQRLINEELSRRQKLEKLPITDVVELPPTSYQVFPEK